MEKIPEVTTAPPPAPEPLNYHQPHRSGRITAWARRLPRPSFPTIALLLLTLGLALWLYKDHAPWVVTRQFDANFAVNSPSAAISPDGTQLAAILRDYQTLRVFDIASGRTLQNLRRPSGDVTTSVFSPDGKRIWSIGSDQQGILWDIPTGTALAELPMDNQHLFSFGSATASPFSPDGRWLALGDRNALRICDAYTGALLQELASGRTYDSPLFSPNSQYLAAVSSSSNVEIWETSTWQPVASLTRPGTFSSMGGRSLAFTPDSRRLVFARYRSIEVWDAPTNTISTTISIPGQLSGCRLVPGGRLLVTYNDNGPEQLMDMTTYLVVGSLTPLGADPEISPDLQRAASQFQVASFPSLNRVATIKASERIAWLPTSDAFLSQPWTDRYSPPNTPIQLFQCRRPEAPYGLLWLPQSWLIFLATLALTWSIHRDLRRWRLHPPPL